jgi:hypothetical protein
MTTIIRLDPAEVLKWCTCDGCRFEREHPPAGQPIIPVVPLPPFRVCAAGCGTSLDDRTARAKYCSQKCQKAASRTGSVAA